MQTIVERHLRGPLQGYWVATLGSGGLMAGALGSQYIGGLYPCEMCVWQRVPHILVLIVAGAVLMRWVKPTPFVAGLVVILLVATATIGGFHAGVEYGWWEGITACTADAVTIDSVEDLATALAAVPVVRCDVVPWSLLGISLAGFNFILSAGLAAAVALSARRS